jgi:poly(A) polymerase
LQAAAPSPASFDPRALQVAQCLRAAGHITYFAGGCVRDVLLGRPPKDVDIVTDATPEAVLNLFPRAHAIGKAFAVVQVLVEGHAFEVATFRRDADYQDGRHPTSVAFAPPEEDAQRRDFTVNGLFYDPDQNRVLDYVGGVRDLEQGIIRAIGDPAARFGEDYLRMLRAVRFASVLQFRIEPATAAAIRERAEALRHISAERIQQELTRLLTESPQAGQGVQMLHDTGLLAVILPEVAALQGVEQPPEYHPEGDVFRHTTMMLDLMQQPSPALAYAVLLHDIGKPPTFRRTQDAAGRERIRFDGHAATGADMAELILRRLRCSNDLIEQVTLAVRQHMRFIDVPNMRRATLRHMVAAPTYPLELELHRLDCLGSHGNLSNVEFLQRFVAELQSEPRLPPPWVTGHDLLAMGIPEGREVGRWRKDAFERQLDGRAGSREELLEQIRRDWQASGPGPASPT